MAAKVPSLSDFKFYKPEIKNYKLKFFLYGDQGIGKTTMAATANGHPLMKDVLFIGCEPGTLSISDESIIGCPKPTVMDFEDFDNLGDLLWFLRNEKHNFKTLVLDTFSELQKKAMDRWLLEKWEREEKKAKAAGQEVVHKNDTLDDVFLEDYGKNTQFMRRLGRHLRDLPMHVILTAHARKETGKDVMPSLTPALAESICSFMDVVGFMYMGLSDPNNKESEPVRKIQTSKIPGYMTKDRSPGQRLGGVTINPTMPMLLDKIIGTES